MLLKTKGFDLVISDIEMPIMDGIALTAAIRKINETQKVLVLSAHTESDYLLKLLNLGIRKFILKPIDYDEFLETLVLITGVSIPNGKKTISISTILT